jgi:hypothetical protein
MPVQENIDIVRRLIGGNVLKTEFQSTAHKIDDQWPFEIAVAISANDSDSGSNRAELIENAFRADISEMPDLIGVICDFLHVLRQTIVRVRQDENARRLFGRGFFLVCHVKQSLAQFDPEWVEKIAINRESSPLRIASFRGPDGELIELLEDRLANFAVV